MSRSQRRQRQRNRTMLLVLALLLLFPFVLDDIFQHLRPAMSAGGGTAIAPTHQGPPSLPSYGGGGGGGDSSSLFSFAPSLGSGSEGNSPGNGALEALAAAERAELDIIREKRSKGGGAAPGERWYPIAPRPSNPSKFFPEPKHPMLSSGVPLTTSPDDPHWVDPAPRAPPPPPREPTRGLASIAPVEPQGPTWPFHTPAAEPARMPAPPPQTVSFEPPPMTSAPLRIQFKAAPRPDPVAAREKLVEVCGRMVPERLAASTSYECMPHAEAEAPPPPKKPADEGGTQTLVLP